MYDHNRSLLYKKLLVEGSHSFIHITSLDPLPRRHVKSLSNSYSHLFACT